MHHPSGPRTPVARGALLVAILAVLLAPTSSALAADASPEPDAPADVPPTTETVHGWPGTTAAPAGLYSWPVSPREHKRMHKHLEPLTGTAPDLVEFTFYAAEPLTQVEMNKHAAGVNADVRTEMWLLDVDGTMVAVVLDWFPDTDPALVTEARAVIESIVVEPTDSGHRLVFRLLEGWDSG